MLFKTTLCIGCMMIILHSALQAQDSIPVNNLAKWDIQTCIAYGKKNNTQINSYRLSQLTSEQEYLLAKAARLPNLSGTASQDFNHANNSGNNSGFTASGSYGVNSLVTLYNGNYITNTILQKNLAVRSASLSIIQQENDITLQITQAYLAILLDKETIIYNADLVKTAQAQVKLEQQKYDVGSVARKDLIQLKAQLAADQYTLVNAKNAEQGDMLTLKQLLLLPHTEGFDIVKPDTIVLTDSVASFYNVEQFALKTRPEVQNGELNIKIANYDVDKARAGYKPSITAGASLSSGYNSGLGNTFAGELNSNFTQQLGVNLTIPIFTKRVVKTQVEEAKINVSLAELNLKNTKIVLSQTVERANINVENAKSQYAAALEAYTYSKESYRIANELLNVGAANTVDFLLQKNQFVQAQQAYIQAKYNELLTLKIYDFYRGIPIKL